MVTGWSAAAIEDRATERATARRSGPSNHFGSRAVRRTRLIRVPLAPAVLASTDAIAVEVPARMSGVVWPRHSPHRRGRLLCSVQRRRAHDRVGDVSIASAADTAAMLRREGDRRDRDPQPRESDEGQHAVAAITPVVPARREPEVSVSEIRTEALIRPRGRRPVQQFAGCPVVPPPPPAGVPPS